MVYLFSSDWNSAEGILGRNDHYSETLGDNKRLQSQQSFSQCSIPMYAPQALHIHINTETKTCIISAVTELNKHNNSLVLEEDLN